jgi:hypothetical protein
MNDDDFTSDAVHEFDDEDGSLEPDRRQVIVGLAAGVVAASAPARAQDGPSLDPLDVRIIRNPARHNEFGVGIQLTAPAGEKIAVALYPRIFQDLRPLVRRSIPRGERHGANGKLEGAVEKLDRFSFPFVPISDRTSYSLDFVLDRKKSTIYGVLSRNEGADKIPPSVPVALVDFLRGKQGLAFDLDLRRAEWFRWDIFGERIQVEGKRGATLTLFLLPNSDCSETSWSEPELRLQLEPNPGSKLWALNSSVSIKKLVIRRVEGDQGDGARVQEDQELARLPRGTNRVGVVRSAAWIGEAEGAAVPANSDLNWELRKPPKDPTSNRYSIGRIRAPRGKPAVVIKQSAPPTRFTLRQWGNARATLAILRAPMEVTLFGPSNGAVEAMTPALFPLADAILTRQDRLQPDRKPNKPGDNNDEVIEETLTGRLDDKAFAIDTFYGSFIVEGDPPPKPSPPTAAKPRVWVGPAKTAPATTSKSDGAGDEEKPILNPLGRRLDRRDDFATSPAKGLTQFHLVSSRDEIVSFDARALLRQITTALPNTRTGSNDVREEARVWSRFDFSGTEIAFRLPLELKPEKQTWPSARGIVTLGQGPCELEQLALPPGESGNDKVCKIAAPVSIALDGARLQARRDSDNLALTFQFARMALELGKSGGRIVPNARLSGGGTGEAASPIGTEARTFDDRPLLIVNFPPQHVAEKVYRQVNDGVSLPDVPGGITGDIAFAAALKVWREMRLSDPRKFTSRQELFNQQKTTAEALLDKDPLYDRVKQGRLLEFYALLDTTNGGTLNWQDKVGDAREELLARWNGLPVDQRAFYLGISPDAMDPDVRKVWSDIWRAYLRAADFLPDVPGSLLGDAAFAPSIVEWTKLADSSARLSKRKAIFEAEQRRLADVLGNPNHPLRQEIVDSGLPQLFALLDPSGAPTNWQDKVGAERTELINRWKTLDHKKDQQTFYIGTSANAMDEDVRRAWEAIWRAFRRANPAVHVTSNADAVGFDAALQALPDPELPDDVKSDVTLRATRPDKTVDSERLRQSLAREKAKRSDDFVNMQTFYAQRRQETATPAGLPEAYSGREAIQEAWGKTTGDVGKVAILTFLRELAKAAGKFQSDGFLPITPARLSGPSRLVFRFDSAGGAVDDPDISKRSTFNEDTERVRSIDFSFDGLTDWGRFDLAVARRAETLEVLPGGRVPHPNMRGFDLDSARILAHQGIRPGRSIEGRLADIRASLREPGQDETAIELPFRLQLSPDQFGRFKTRRTIAADVLRAKSGHGAPLVLKIDPMLWSANLQIGDLAPKVRAIWSDDFDPNAIGGGSDGPMRGPNAPWQAPPKKNDVPAQFRTALDAYDRHEIVALTSAYGLPVMGRRNELESLVDASQFEPPKGYKLDGLKLYKANTKDADLSAIYNPTPLNVSELRLTALGGSLRHDSSFIPPAGAVRADGRNVFDAFSVERWRQITVLGRDIEVEVVYKGFLFPLGVRAALVKLTERRFVRNDKNGVHTAFLIQRMFIRIGNPLKSFPAVGQANRSRRFPLSDLTMLTRETADIVDPSVLGSPAPLDIGDNRFVSLHPNGQLAFKIVNGGGAPDAKLPGLCFWPRTRAGDGGNIWFEFKVESDATPLRMPLIFIDNRAVNRPEVVRALADYYNWEKDAPSGLKPANTRLRNVAMGGAKRRYADENKDGECQFETYRWEIRAEGREDLVKKDGGSLERGNVNYEFDPVLQGSDQPPFYPYVYSTTIRVGQAERFVGRPLDPREAKFYAVYQNSGFPSAADAAEATGKNATDAQRKDYYQRHLERYLTFGEKPLSLNMGEGGDRSGGIGRPAMDVVYLSRRYGLMPAGDVAPSEQDDSGRARPAAVIDRTDDQNEAPVEPSPPPFNLQKFFNPDAKLLGILSFSDLLSLAGSAIPELKEQVDSATEDTAEFLRQSVLPEIQRALKALEEMWQAASKALTSQASATGGIGSLEINKIYPDIAPALNDLMVKVERAEKASNVELIGAMTAVQASGRKFVTAINRTLADPVAPLRDELRGKFRLISQLVQQFGDGLSGLIRSAIENLARDLKGALKQQIHDYLHDNMGVTAFTRLVLALPTPATLPALAPGEAKAVADKLDGAVSEGTIAFFDAILTGDVLVPDPQARETAMRAALQSGLAATEDKLKSSGLSGKAAEYVDAYKTEAKALLDDLKSEKDAIRQDAEARLLRQVTGILYPLLFNSDGAVQAVVNEATELVNEVAGGGRDVLDTAARHIANALHSIARLLVEQQTNQLCERVAAKLAEVAERMLPPAESSTSRPKSLTTLLKAVDALKELAASKKVTDDSVAVVARYKKIRSSLTTTLIADACGPDETKAAIAATLAKVLQEVTSLKHEINALAADVVSDCTKLLSSAAQTGAAIAVGTEIGFRTNFIKNDTDAVVTQVAEQLSEFIGSDLDKFLGELDTAIPPKPALDTAVNRAIAEQIDQLHAIVGGARVTLHDAAAMIKYVADPATTSTTDPLLRLKLMVVVLDGAARHANDDLADRLKDARDRLLARFAAQASMIERGALAAVKQAEASLMAILGDAFAAQQAAKRAAVRAVARIVRPILEVLRDTIYAPAKKLRDLGQSEINSKDDASAAASIIKRLLKTLRGPNGQAIADIFAVPPIDENGHDQLEQDIARFDRLTSATPADAYLDNTYVGDLSALTEDWRNRTASPILLLRNIGYVLTAVLKGDLAQFVDLHQIRRQVDEAIRAMVPSRVSRSYDLKIKLRDIDDLVLFSDKTDGARKLGLPKPHPQGIPETLVLRASGVVDLLQPAKSTFSAQGFLPGFGLQLLPVFDVVTLSFPPTTFTGGQGQPFHLALKIEDVQLGEKVQFLKKIQSIMSAPADGNGFFLRFLSGGLGIVAGYALPISPITIGNMFIDGLSLNVAAELPFDSGDARFVIGISRAEAPFMIAVAPYAGAGHLALIANPKGIIGFEASLQFGGGGGFSFGPLTGKGRISVGIFIRQLSGVTELYGLFYAGGSAHIACFGVGAQLNVRLSQQGGDAAGEAIFTFSFSIGIKDIEFSIAVFKKEKGSGGGNSKSAHASQGKTVDLAADEFRGVFARQLRDLPTLINRTFCKGENFAEYQKYFSKGEALAPGRQLGAAATRPVAVKPRSTRAEPAPRVHPSIWVMP